MPHCPSCEETVQCTAALWLHLKLKHQAGKCQAYTCHEKNCSRVFSNWKKFCEHLIKIHHCSVAETLSHKSSESSNQPTHNTDAESEQSTNYQDFSEPMEQEEVPSENTYDIISRSILLFFLSLYANYSLPRSFVQDIIDSVRVLVSDMVTSVLKLIRNRLKKENISEHVIKDIEDILYSLLDPFKRYSTEYRRLKCLQKDCNLIPFEPYIVSDRIDDKIVKGSVVQEVVVQAHYMSMRTVLSMIFSLPNVFQKVEEYMNYLWNEMDCVENFVQGKLWRKKVHDHFEGKFVVPLFVYFDDFEINIPRGSHMGIQKLGVLYYSIPCFPPEFNSLMENVLMAGLFHSSDRTSFSNCRVFHKVIDELNYLQDEGILIPGINKRVYFSLGLLLGDNVGLNGILGFVESFTAYYYCRFCKMSKFEIQYTLSERHMRYNSSENDILLNDVHLTGIKEASVWNEVKFFSTTNNFSVDWLHDGPEGWGREIVTLVLYFLCKEITPVEQRLSLNILNSRLRSFDCHHNAISNRPPQVSFKELDNKSLKMSGSEWQNFIFIFSMLFGDLVPPECKHWKLYCMFRQIMDIVLCRRVQPEYPKLLKNLVIETLQLFKELYPRETVKPKAHNFIHYGTAMEQSGPLINLSTASFERKHKEKKKDANATTSRKNITHTLTIKEQLSLCKRFMLRKGLDEKYEDYGGEKCYDHVSKCEFFHLFKSTLPLSFDGPCLVLNWVKMRGVTYRKNICVILRVSLDVDGVDCLPVFGTIENILQNEMGEFLLVCKVSITYGFSSHYHAYELTWPRNKVLECVSVNDLVTPFPVILHRMGDGSVFATVRHKLL